MHSSLKTKESLFIKVLTAALLLLSLVACTPAESPNAPAPAEGSTAVSAETTRPDAGEATANPDQAATGDASPEAAAPVESTPAEAAPAGEVAPEAAPAV